MNNKLKIVNGEISYLSDSDDQSYGMWCPVSYECRHYFKEGDVLVVAKELESRIAELEQAILEIDGGHSYNDTFLKIDEAVSLVNKGKL